ncbi:MAG: hypothetical protein LZF84_06230 [Nitrosomonas sp.]|nr:MAG: hypothetical protein LZF84_06230 [Nitrosomonas sp.]
MTAGIKFLDNAYSHGNFSPNARLLWTPDAKHNFGFVSEYLRFLQETLINSADWMPFSVTSINSRQLSSTGFTVGVETRAEHGTILNRTEFVTVTPSGIRAGVDPDNASTNSAQRFWPVHVALLTISHDDGNAQAIHPLVMQAIGMQNTLCKTQRAAMQYMPSFVIERARG